MVIKLKNKHILEVDEFQFRCCIGKRGTTNRKVEGDLCTPKGTFKLKEIFFGEGGRRVDEGGRKRMEGAGAGKL